MRLSLGISPCPNDTFMFYHLLQSGRFPLDLTIADVEELNERALNHELDISKVSLYAAMQVRDCYTLLDSGAALGKDCGPLLVGRAGEAAKGLQGARIAVPGRHTTANLLFTLYAGEQGTKVFMRFDQIMKAVREGIVDFGVIIHEGRFTYGNYGLTELVDLGEWWTGVNRMPVPLGGVIARKEIPGEVRAAFTRALRDSIARALAEKNDYRSPLYAFVREHAREMKQEVIGRHIDLYVNNYSLSLGEEGRTTVQRLLNLGIDH